MFTLSSKVQQAGNILSRYTVRKTSLHYTKCFHCNCLRCHHKHFFRSLRYNRGITAIKIVTNYSHRKQHGIKNLIQLFELLLCLLVCFLYSESYECSYNGGGQNHTQVNRLSNLCCSINCQLRILCCGLVTGSIRNCILHCSFYTNQKATGS